jgi:hypothetical protein
MPVRWIKIDVGTFDKPEVARIATRVNLDVFGIIGRLARLWGYVDEHGNNGRIDGVDAAFFDAMLQCQGFSAAVASVGWLAIDETGVSVPKFDRHNGKAAKTRVQAAARQLRRRKRDNKRDKCHAAPLTQAQHDPTEDVISQQGALFGDDSKAEPVSARKRFVKPTEEEVTAYCEQEGIKIDVTHFYSHHESKGWKVGRVPMVNWKAAVRTWERNTIAFSNTGGQANGKNAARIKPDPGLYDPDADHPSARTG